MQTMIPVSMPDLHGRELEFVTKAINDGWISSSGEFLGRFEQMFADFCKTKHAIACCNGTVVIHLTLLAMGIGPGDEVIVPSFTYVASANAVHYTGATPVFVDSEPDYFSLDLEGLRKAITPHTKAIMAVHLYGHPANMDEVRRIADAHGIPVIEDAAEAHGAEVRGKRVGSLGFAATFSFYGNKIVTTGEGGMITTDDDALAAKIRQLRGQGMDPERRYWFPIVGYNYRMTNVAAAIGCGQMERIEELVGARISIARLYNAALEGEARTHGIILPKSAPWAKSVYWLYSIRVPKTARDPLMAYLFKAGIDTRPFFPPMHTLPMYPRRESFPVAEELAATGINLPTYTALTPDQIGYISDKILLFFRDRS